MTIKVLLSSILATFATMHAPDLCEDVYVHADGSPYSDLLGQVFPRFCEWTGPDAPVWDDTVCCTFEGEQADCVAPTRETCPTGAAYYCEYGQLYADGSVTCYHPYPSMCDAGLCLAPPPEPPLTQAFLACCSAGGACQPIVSSQLMDCDEADGIAIYCMHGMTMNDGTIECYD